MTKSVFTNREIPIASSCSIGQVDAALVLLKEIPGVVRAKFDSQKNCISIEYDLLINSYAVFENLLVKQGVYQKSSIKLRLLSMWFDYLDTTARDNYLAPPASCCNKPPRPR